MVLSKEYTTQCCSLENRMTYQKSRIILTYWQFQLFRIQFNRIKMKITLSNGHIKTEHCTLSDDVINYLDSAIMADAWTNNCV